MFKKIIFSSVITSIIASTAVFADETDRQSKKSGWLVGANAGVSLLSDVDAASFNFDFNPGIFVAGSAGYKFENNIRAEAEIGYRRNSIDNVNGRSLNGKLQGLSFMANGYYDFDTNTKWTPYLGAGIGATYFNISSSGSSADDIAFSYQAIAGVGYDLTEETTLSVEYRYFGAADIDIGADTDYNSHTVGLGVRFDL